MNSLYRLKEDFVLTNFVEADVGAELSINVDVLGLDQTEALKADQCEEDVQEDGADIKEEQDFAPFQYLERLCEVDEEGRGVRDDR